MQAKTNLARSKLAAEAEVGIYVMGAVIAMLEGGVTPGGPDGTSVTAKKIITLAKREQQRQLKRMDKHRALIREASNAG